MHITVLYLGSARCQRGESNLVRAWRLVLRTGERAPCNQISATGFDSWVGV